ncbi:uncharacterized protein LOC118419348 [Branchiostoma floridae]|uniref:Uncharacterized protein LOC118419348 n=1 Tax=Branchiostoma floridae TaxID=7739 RepID=A0A9J7LG40_BRAFL|nr:uncharacterized protein LOC118419348 [Branchiostoma floridae]
MKVTCQALGLPGANSYVIEDGPNDGIVVNVSCLSTNQTAENCSLVTDAILCSNNSVVRINCRDQFRLVTGTLPHRGRLERYRDRRWEAVCAESWGQEQTEMACRSLGFPGAVTYYTQVLTDTNNGSVANTSCVINGTTEDCTNATCISVNGTIENCSVVTDNTTCRNNSVVAVHCHDRTRLAGGALPHRGRLEMYYGTRWWAVCAADWGHEETENACDVLGYPGAIEHFTEDKTGDSIVANVSCLSANGTSENCTHNFVTEGDFCRNHSVVRLHCQDQFRLVSRTLPHRGRLERYRDRRWEPVCAESWGQEQTEMACRSLGFPGAVTYCTEALMDTNNGSVVNTPCVINGTTENCTSDVSTNVSCVVVNGTRENCSFATNNTSCRNNSVIAVHCHDRTRLVGGAVPHRGRLELYYGTRWWAVCAADWGHEETENACQVLGYPGAISHVTAEETGDSIVANVSCLGINGTSENCTRSFATEGDFCRNHSVVRLHCQGNIRIADGPMRNLGRLEVHHGTRWWPVCADDWGMDEAEVACQTLGYPGAVSSFPGTSIFGKGGGLVARVSCVRSDGASNNCTRVVVTDGVTCGNNSVVGIYCHAALRLVNGSSYNEGRVEIFRSGRWGTVCDSPHRPPDERWGRREAEVVCRQLMFGVERIYPPGWFGDGENGSSAIWLGRVHCSGLEDELQWCDYTRWGVHLEDVAFCRENFAVAVACGGPPGPFLTTAAPPTREDINAGNIRLVDWPLSDFAKLEVYNNASWRAVCDHNWDDDITEVVCEILDYPGARNYTTSGYLFGQGESVILNASVSCNTSSNVTANVTSNDCTWAMFTDGDQCQYEKRVGIQCQESIRLVNGSTEYEGRVEIYHDNRWGTICDHPLKLPWKRWGLHETLVVCGQLGYLSPFELPEVLPLGYFGDGENETREIWLDDVVCNGTESNLKECHHGDWGPSWKDIFLCSEDFAVAIVCRSAETTTPVPFNVTTNATSVFNTTSGLNSTTSGSNTTAVFNTTSLFNTSTVFNTTTMMSTTSMFNSTSAPTTASSTSSSSTTALTSYASPSTMSTSSASSTSSSTTTKATTTKTTTTTSTKAEATTSTHPLVLATSKLTTVTSTHLPPTQSSIMSISPSSASPGSTTTLIPTSTTTAATTTTTTTIKSTTTTTTKKQATKKKKDDDNNDDDNNDDDENNDEQNDESKNSEPEEPEEPEVPPEEEEDIVAAAGIPGGAVGGMAVGGAAAAAVAKKMMNKDDEEEEDDNEDDDGDDDDDDDGDDDGNVVDADDDVGPDVIDDAVQTSQSSLLKNYDDLTEEKLIETINDLYFRPPSIASEASSHSNIDSTGNLEDNFDDLEENNVGIAASLRSLAALSATESTFQLKRSLSRLGGRSLLEECQPLLCKSSPLLNQAGYFDGFVLPIPVSLSSPHIGADELASDGGESILSQSLTFEQEGSPLECSPPSEPFLPLKDDVQFVDETEPLLSNQVLPEPLQEEQDRRKKSLPKSNDLLSPIDDEPITCEKVPLLNENLPQLSMPSLHAQDTGTPIVKEELPLFKEKPYIYERSDNPIRPYDLKNDLPLTKDLVPDEEDANEGTPLLEIPEDLPVDEKTPLLADTADEDKDPTPVTGIDSSDIEKVPQSKPSLMLSHDLQPESEPNQTNLPPIDGAPPEHAPSQSDGSSSPNEDNPDLIDSVLPFSEDAPNSGETTPPTSEVIPPIGDNAPPSKEAESPSCDTTPTPQRSTSTPGNVTPSPNEGTSPVSANDLPNDVTPSTVDGVVPPSDDTLPPPRDSILPPTDASATSPPKDEHSPPSDTSPPIDSLSPPTDASQSPADVALPLSQDDSPSSGAVPPPSDAAPPPSDAIKPPSDAVPPPSDAVPPPSDAVPPPSDAVPPPSDAVPPPSDAVPPPSDAVPPPSDAVPPPSDAVTPPSDAVPPPSDAVPPPSDAIKPPSDGVPPPSDEIPPLSDKVPAPSDGVSPPSDEAPPLTDKTPSPADKGPPPSDEIPPPADGVPPPSDEVPSPSDGVPPPSDEIPPSSEKVPAPRDGVPPPSDETLPLTDKAPPPSDGVPPPSDEVPPQSDGVPSPNDGVPPPNDGIPSPNDGVPPPNDGVPPPRDGVPSPNDGVTPPNDIPPPSDEIPPPSDGVPPPSDEGPPPNDISSPSDAVPPPSDPVPPPSDAIKPPSDEIPSPSDGVPPPSDEIPPPSDKVPAPSDGVPPPSDEAPLLTDKTPPPSDGVPPPSGEVPPPSDGVPSPNDGGPPPSDGVPSPNDGVPSPNDNPSELGTPAAQPPNEYQFQFLFDMDFEFEFAPDGSINVTPIMRSKNS